MKSTCLMQVPVQSLDASTEYVVLQANFSRAPACRAACYIKLLPDELQGVTRATPLHPGHSCIPEVICLFCNLILLLSGRSATCTTGNCINDENLGFLCALQE